MEGYTDYQLAASKFAEREYDAALALLNQSLAQGDHYKTRHLLCHVLHALGRNTEAIQHLKAAYSMNSKNDRVACDYASELCRSGEMNRAREVLAEILARNPSYSPARSALRMVERKQ